MIDARFSTALSRAVEDGLIAAALVDHDGTAVGLAGAIGVEEPMPLAARVLQQLQRDQLASRLFAGEIVSLLDDRPVAVGIAGRRLVVVAVLAASTPSQLELVRELRYAVGRMLADAAVDPIEPRSGGSAGGSGPAQFPLAEHTRERGKA